MLTDRHFKISRLKRIFRDALGPIVRYLACVTVACHQLHSKFKNRNVLDVEDRTNNRIESG